MDDAMYQRMLPVFVTEAEHKLDEVDEAILSLAKNGEDADARQLVALAAHTIRGNAATLGLRQMVIEAQHLELWATAPVRTGANASTLAHLHETRAVLRRLLDEVANDAPLVLL